MAGVLQLHAQGTAFTYQGRLNDANSEVSALRAGNAELKQQNDALAQKLDALEKLVQTLIENQ